MRNMNIFKSGGKLGRLTYVGNIISSLLLHYLCCALMGLGYGVYVGLTHGSVNETVCLGLAIPSLIGYVYLYVIASHKRVRDIFDCENVPVKWTAGLFIPIISTLVFVYLLFAPGKKSQTV